MTKLMIKTIFLSCLFFAFAGQANSQEACKTVQTLAQENASIEEYSKQWNCWRLRCVYGVLNMSGAYLPSADLTRNCPDLSGRNFTGANLRSATISNSNLLYANFSRANLRGANLSYSDVSGASFENADLSGADFTWAKSHGANFKWIRLQPKEKIIRLRLKNMVCTRSDDEGPGNDADISYFYVGVKGNYRNNWNELYKFRAATEGDQKTIPKGYNWVVNEEFLFSAEDNQDVKFEIRVSLIEADAGNVDGGAPDDEKSDETFLLNVTVNSQAVRYSVVNSDVGFDLYFEYEIVYTWFPDF